LNQILSRSGNGKRRESTAVGAQSCENKSFDRPDSPITSTSSAFFTVDYVIDGPHLRQQWM